MTKKGLSGDSKFFIGVVIAAVLIIAGVVWYSSKHGSSLGSISNVDVAAAPTVGPNNAKVKIIEFGDFECPFCAQAAPGIRAVQTQNSDVQLIFKQFPLISIHKNAQSSAQASYAAQQQNKFWEMYDLLYANQDSWANNADPSPVYITYAKNLGLDIARFTSDMNSDAAKNEVQKEYNYALSLGLNETPTFIVNGTKYTGPQTADQWNQILANARK